ncbi:MAG: hypothetical protein HN368_13575 [Spirochaetales bacterium]|jgi:hypothetical protein|nr:hypothetical protein [Spirochaetales bacterium]
MEGNTKFNEDLEKALERNRNYLELTRLPQVKARFESYTGTFQNFHNVLLRKSLIKEDPYKADQKISEIVLPQDAEVSEIEKNNQIGLRLSMFDSQLAFLLNYYQFTVDYLSLKRIKLLGGLTRFINWDNLSTSSTSVNTRLLAELVGKVRGGSDAFSIQVLNNAQSQLASLGNEIVRSLKDLSRYHRERYKLEIRKSVFDFLNLTPEQVQTNKASAIAAVKKKFSNSVKGMPFYGELVDEILVEDYGPNPAAKHEAALKQFVVTEEKAKKAEKIDYRGYVLEAIRRLSASGKPIERTLEKLNQNSIYVEDSRKQLDGPFRKWLSRMLGRVQEARIYEIETVDPVTAVAKKNNIDFDNLYQKGIKTARLIASYGSKMSPGYARLDSMDEATLYTLLERQIIEVQNLMRTFPALYDYFQDAIDDENRGKLFGIKLETNAIRNSVVKANQHRHEYVSRKEEQEQLKKLGIKN